MEVMRYSWSEELEGGSLEKKWQQRRRCQPNMKKECAQLLDGRIPKLMEGYLLRGGETWRDADNWRLSSLEGPERWSGATVRLAAESSVHVLGSLVCSRGKKEEGQGKAWEEAAAVSLIGERAKCRRWLAAWATGRRGRHARRWIGMHGGENLRVGPRHQRHRVSRLSHTEIGLGPIGACLGSSPVNQKFD